MTTATTDLTIDTTANPAIDPAEFAALGEGHIAYVRPIRSDEVRSLFPQAPEMTPDSTCSPCSPRAARRSC